MKQKHHSSVVRTKKTLLKCGQNITQTWVACKLSLNKLVQCSSAVFVRLVQLRELNAHIQVQSKHITIITFTSQGSIIPKEPGKNSPDERSWKARLK